MATKALAYSTPLGMAWFFILFIFRMFVVAVVASVTAVAVARTAAAARIRRTAGAIRASCGEKRRLQVALGQLARRSLAFPFAYETKLFFICAMVHLVCEFECASR